MIFELIPRADSHFFFRFGASLLGPHFFRVDKGKWVLFYLELFESNLVFGHENKKLPDEIVTETFIDLVALNFKPHGLAEIPHHRFHTTYEELYPES